MTPVADAPAQVGVRTVFAIAACLLLSGCGGLHGRGPRFNADGMADAVPDNEPRSRYGNPDSYVVDGKRYYTLSTATGFTERGIASWYGNPFHGQRTSSGEIYDMYRMTGAHKQLPLPTYVQVRNLDNGRTATLKVNDRGPFKDNRVIDLSYAAALKLGVVAKGTAFVEIRALDALGQRGDAETAERVPLPAISTQALAVGAPAPPVMAVAPPAQTSTPPAPKPKPASAPVLSAMYLQVGAYAERRNAEKISAQLARTIATRVEIREIKSNNKLFYRVQIGPLASTERADQVVSALEKLGITQHYFITN